MLIDPPQVPVSVIDLERAGIDRYVHVNTPMSDPCASCGAFRMVAGEWYIFGQCERCEHEELYGTAP